jgi:hypothetical protein
MGKNTLKKYLPATIFIKVVTIALDIYGEKKKWWKFHRGIPPFNSMNFFDFGPYFVTTLWILKLTYGKLRLFLITNFFLHILFISKGIKYAKKYKIFSFINLSKFQYLVIDFLRAILLYTFQYIVDLSLINKSNLPKIK